MGSSRARRGSVGGQQAARRVDGGRARRQVKQSAQGGLVCLSPTMSTAPTTSAGVGLRLGSRATRRWRPPSPLSAPAGSISAPNKVQLLEKVNEQCTLSYTEALLIGMVSWDFLDLLKERKDWKAFIDAVLDVLAMGLLACCCSISIWTVIWNFYVFGSGLIGDYLFKPYTENAVQLV